MRARRTPARRDSPFHHLAALIRWAVAVAVAHPKAAQWVATGCLSLVIGGGAALGITARARPPASPPRAEMPVDRRWLTDSFPVYLRPMIRRVVQEENVPVFAKLDTLDEKNREVRRFIVSTAEYLRWKALRRQRLEEEHRIEREAEDGFRPRRP